MNGFGTGPASELTATVSGADASYSRTITDAQPELYWRLGETSGTLAADASGHGRTGLLASPASDRKHTGGLANDPDGGLVDGRAWYSSSYDLLRVPTAAGLPTGDRTVEGWVWSDNAGARLISYGDFSVEVTERGLVVGGTALNLPRRRPAAVDGQPLAPHRGHGTRGQRSPAISTGNCSRARPRPSTR